MMRYIDQLLQGAEVKWKKLGEVCSIKTGKGITKKDAATDGKYPIISGGKTPMGYIDVFNRQANTVTVSRVGANAGFVSYITECFYLNDKCFSAVPKESCPVIGQHQYLGFLSIDGDQKHQYLGFLSIDRDQKHLYLGFPTIGGDHKHVL